MEEKENLYKEENLLQKDLQFEAKEKESVLGFFQRGLTKTKKLLVDDLKESLMGEEELDEALFDEIEELLLSADIGVPTSRKILEYLENLYAKGQIKNKSQSFLKLKEIVANILKNQQKPFELKKGKTNVFLFVGVNGVGKTTTIGKIAHKIIAEKKVGKVLLAAGDTYRAAAIEQLEIWAKKSGADIIAKETGADSAATIFEATEKAMNENYDCLICDTSGRLHTNKNLMAELVKIKKVLQKLAPDHKTILVLDANTGQNAIKQTKIFLEMVEIDALIITKLDGSAKGGVVIGLVNEFKLPIYFLGLGESKEALQEFDPELFTKILFS